MRGSELEGKEIINSRTGERLGIIKEIELWLNLTEGRVEGLILARQGLLGKERDRRTIPWKAVQKIGADLIVVDWNEEPIPGLE